MKIISKRKTKTITETIRHKTDAGITIIETIVNGKHKGFTLDSKLKIEKSEHRLNYVIPFLFKKGAFTKKAMKRFIDYKNYNILSFIDDHKVKLTSLDDINKYDLYFYYSAGEILFEKDLVPISMPYVFNYIGGLREKQNKRKIYEKLIKKFSSHPYVLYFEEEIIPYYNREFEGQKGIKIAIVYIPQKIYLTLWKKYKDKEYWSTRIKEQISLGYNSNMNIYGKEITDLIKKYNRSYA